MKLLAIALLFTSGMFAQAAQHFNTLTWSWTQGTGDPATGYHVKRANVSGGPYITVGTILSVTSTTFIDTNVVAGQTNYYIVTAFNTSGDSAPSSEVRCDTPFSPPSSSPTSLSGTAK